MPKYKSVEIRIVGDSDQIQEALRRLAHVLELSEAKLFQKSREQPTHAYLRAYFYEYSLLDELEAAKRDIQQMSEELGEAQLQIERLKRKLGELPQPQTGDVVLGSAHIEKLKA